MYTYKYNFASKGVIANHRNILAYILCISVVDHKDVSVDELIYLVSEFAGDGVVGPGDGFHKYLQMIMETWTALKAIDPMTNEGRQANDSSSLAFRTVNPGRA